MSLVDYASSSDDDVSEAEEEQPQVPKHELSPPPTLARKNQISGSSSNQQQESAALLSSPAIEKLPDASILLNSPTVPLVSGYDHVSRVAAAMAESALRKRDSNVQSSLLPRNKIPRGTLPRTKNVSDTVSGVLVPPQLTGRSNVVTEDIGKLFVKRHADPDVRGSAN